jgi:hypothetical protein
VKLEIFNFTFQGIAKERRLQAFFCCIGPRQTTIRAAGAGVVRQQINARIEFLCRERPAA